MTGVINRTILNLIELTRPIEQNNLTSVYNKNKNEFNDRGTSNINSETIDGSSPVTTNGKNQLKQTFK